MNKKNVFLFVFWVEIFLVKVYFNNDDTFRWKSIKNAQKKKTTTSLISSP